MGFAPQLVDMNDDGLVDILSGSYCGDAPQPEGHTGHPVAVKDENGNFCSEIFIYYKQADGTYADRVSVALSHTHSAANAVDWDGDGDYDLITAARIVTQKDADYGLINLMENVGSKKEPKFSKPRYLLEGVEFKRSALVSAEAWDWDKDGDLDILASTEFGDIWFFERSGDSFESPLVLIKGSVYKEEPKPWGSRLVLHITDWDGDGTDDILAGDVKTIQLTEEEILKGKSDAEIAEYHELKALNKKINEEIQKLYEGVDFGKLSESERKDISKKAEAIYDSYGDKPGLLYQKYPSSVYHGYVWVFPAK